ncbi:TetR/AcrR family transcriptional regulator [Acidaminobacter hydrogenoformans]|uniref:Transcriptional regulator, TetR family n=1 Tax=Acidaminobacter hydrogenoformans DSM 2784 TaxID=1120920 RepID=A0A1G5S4D8_9FIRM|nr:TetR/AcrR family transcriptional regulator [Acidaminobacter hydrogenoformans]SCZ80700.1 transcriptional regulator, TetR family [Acidaminobacter hydrogenoformans DSM 2784]
MVSKFEALDPEKQNRILKAAFEEFVRNGYERASTNEIIKNADISKGALFVYFGSKKKLFIYLFHYAVGIIQQILKEMDLEESDFFERVRQLGLIKLRHMRQMPYAFDFLEVAIKENDADFHEEFSGIKHDVISRSFALMNQNIDYSKFREDFELEKVLNMINWVMLGFSEQARSKLGSYEEADESHIQVFDDYIEIMKRCFYKPTE